MDNIAEIRLRHFIENETITTLAEAFKLSRPTIRKHLKTIDTTNCPWKSFGDLKKSRQWRFLC